MPKPTGTTQKGRAIQWLRQNARGQLISVRHLARELQISPASIRAAMKELEANGVLRVERSLGGVNTRWRITRQK